MILAPAGGLTDMPKIKVDISVSLDGFVAGPDQTLEEPLGRGGELLHEWAFGARAWRQAHGREGGERNNDSASSRRAWRASAPP
jgi:hypothetical protein